MANHVQIKACRPWHEELLEFILANPRASGAEVAFYFGVTEAWVSTVKNTDAFRELWAQRRAEHFSRVSTGVAEKLTTLAEVTLDALTDKIEKDKRSGEVQYTTLKEVSEMTLKSLGFGAKPAAQVNAPVVNVNNYVVDKDTLARAREAKARLTGNSAAEAQAPKLIEATVEKETVT